MVHHRRWVTTIPILAVIAFAPAAKAGPFDNVLKKMGDTVNKRTEDLGAKAVDGAFDTADDAINCAAGDVDCQRRARARQTAAVATVKPAGPARCVATDVDCLQDAKRRGAKVEIVEAPTPKPAGPARCVVTDVACLQDAKKRGVNVEIVEESELDTIRCPISDTACMQRAKKLGKKIELLD